MDIDTIAEELYSLPTAEFTAARNAREKEAKGLGDGQLVAAIHQLRKPSTGAWLANQLARQHADEVEELLDLGAALREATATLSGDQLRELGKQRRQLVHALMGQVRQTANAAGRKVSQETSQSLQDTLHAALADEDAAQLLRSGRLIDTLRSAGFPVTAGTTSAKPSPSTSPPAAADEGSEDRRADQLGRAERDEQLAQATVRDAAVDRDRAQTSVDRAKEALHEVVAIVSELRASLGKAEIEQAQRETEHDQAQAGLDTASRARSEAAQRLELAVQSRERLST